DQKRAEAELKAAKDAAEAALAESRQLSVIMEATTDLVAMVDMQGQVIYLNRAGRQLSGLDEDSSLEDFSMMEFYHPESAQKMMTEYIPTAMRDGVWFGENIILTPDGNEVPVSQVGLVVRDAQGNPEFLATIIRD